MSVPANRIESERSYTYDDWLNLDDGVHAEIIDGNLIMMAEPSQRHQEILVELSTQLRTFLRGKQCRVLPAPFGVRLFKKKHTILEPDILVVCDRSKLNGKICDGAPDLVIEIVSPSNFRHDTFVKFNLYLQAGVKEYWIVYPEEAAVMVYKLKEAAYEAAAYNYPEQETIPVGILPGLEIDLKLVFEQEQAEP